MSEFRVLVTGSRTWRSPEVICFALGELLMTHSDLLVVHGGCSQGADYPVVGVGSVCRRQGTGEIAEIFRVLAQLDLPLHGFGVKTAGLARYGRWLTTVDSMAWSFQARRNPPLAEPLADLLDWMADSWPKHEPHTTTALAVRGRSYALAVARAINTNANRGAK